MVKIYHPERMVSYAELEQILQPLGFTKHVVQAENALVYVNRTKGASIILPIGELNDKLNPLDLLTVRRTVVEKGVASLETYKALTRRVRLNELHRSTPRKFVRFDTVKHKAYRGLLSATFKE